MWTYPLNLSSHSWARTQAQAQSGGEGPARARPVASLGPRPGSRAQECKEECNMLIHGWLRICCYAFWRNFANIGSSVNLTTTARTPSKFCARSRSQSQQIFNLDKVSWGVSGNCEPWPECHSVLVQTKVR